MVLLQTLTTPGPTVDSASPALSSQGTYHLGVQPHMHYRVFYLFARTGESVSSGSAVEMSAKDIREQILPRLHTEDDFIGLIDAADNTLQVLCETTPGRYWIELPMDAARASYGRHVGFSELSELIGSLPQVFDRADIPGLEYRPW